MGKNFDSRARELYIGVLYKAKTKTPYSCL